MGNISSICYKRSFLNQVIVRLDFFQLVSSDVIINQELEKIIVGYYPRKGKDQLIRFNSINFDFQKNGMANAKGIVSEGIQKEYLTSENNKLIISNQFLVFEINNYSIFEEHLKGFRDIIQEFCRLAKVPIKRTGIRYVNIFGSDEIKLQKKYFSSEIASTFVAKVNDNLNFPALIRSMHTNEYRMDQMKISFRYGMFNPDYPNLLKKNSFVLDYDCYVEDALEGSENVLQIIEHGHDAIQELFENSITDSLRAVLQNE